MYVNQRHITRGLPPQDISIAIYSREILCPISPYIIPVHYRLVYKANN